MTYVTIGEHVFGLENKTSGTLFWIFHGFVIAAVSQAVIIILLHKCAHKTLNIKTVCATALPHT